MLPQRNTEDVIVCNQDNKFLPHQKEFSDYYDSIPELKAIKKFDPILAGGWPLAMLAAPRTRQGVDRKYFSDFDVYAETVDQIEDILATLSTMNYINIFQSENATTFTFSNGIAPHSIQVVTKPEYVGTAQNVILRFDFVNCAIAYKPLSDEVFMHKDLIKYHLKQELQVLHPWMLHEADFTGNATYIITQITRFFKYADRWSYELSEDSLLEIMKVYKRWPNIEVNSKQGISDSSGRKPVSGGYYHLWKDLAPRITASKYWKQELDTHGYINQYAKPNSLEMLGLI